MKKLLVLSALLGLLALPAFTADVSFGGDLTFGFITDFDAEAEDTNATIDMKGSVDDYNSVAISVDGLAALDGTTTLVLGDDNGDIVYAWDDANDDGVVDAAELSPITVANTLGLEKAVITTDIGAWLGLPVGVKLQWGYDDPDWNWFGDVSVFEKEALSGAWSPEYWGLDLYVTFGMFELELAGNPGAVGDPGDFMAGVAVKEPIEGLNAELYFYQGGADNNATVEDWDMASIDFGAGYATAFGDLDFEAGVDFRYNMDDAVANAWQYGFAVNAGYSIAYVDVALTGNETDALGDLYVYASVAPIDLLKVFVDAQMAFRDAAAEAFQGMEFGLEFETGATWWAVGYQINNDAFGGLNAPDALADGGLFCYWDINY